MRAAVALGDQIEVREMEVPQAGSGHVLVKSLVSGICGSDLHALADLQNFAALTEKVSGLFSLDPDQGVVFGHEFCAEIVEYGPDTSGVHPIGTRVCSVPVIVGPQGVETLGYSTRFPGSLAEYFVLQEALIQPVPAGLPNEVAALCEPLAVGEHAVAMADVGSDDVCLVVGCGPVGLAVIAALRARGHGPIVAADFSPRRRAQAERFGADEVIDPADHSPHDGWRSFGIAMTPGERAVAQMTGVRPRNAVIFEAVGLPGMIQGLIDEAPARARIIVVGVCMHTDHFEPFLAVAKEIEIRFAFGYSPAEFSTTLDRLKSGSLDPNGLVTEVVPLDQVGAAFSALRSPDEHGKILVQP